MAQVELSQEEFIAVLRRTMDEDGWLQPILDHPDSAVLLKAYIEQFIRVSQSGERGAAVGLISTAPGGTQGLTQVTVSKDNALSGFLLSGQTFEDSRGMSYAAQMGAPVPVGPFSTGLSLLTFLKSELVNTVDPPDLRFSPSFIVADASNATPIVVQTSTQHQYNTGDMVRVTGVEGNEAANGVFAITVLSTTEFELNGSVGSGPFFGLDGVVQPAPLGLVIDTITPVTGGSSDYLSVLAGERGQQRQNGETTAKFRQRALTIPDAVSPTALAEVVIATADTLGLNAPKIYEPFDLEETQALRDDRILNSLGQFYCDVASFLDNPFQRPLSNRESSAWFLVTFEPPDVVFNPGGFLDLAYVDFNAYMDAQTQSALTTAAGAIAQEVSLRKAAGVSFDVELDGVLDRIDGLGSTTSGVITTVFTLTPPPGRAWMLWDMVACGSAPSFLGGTEQTRFTFTDASTFSTPLRAGMDSRHLTIEDLIELGYPLKPISQIEGRIESDGALTSILTSHFWVVEIDL